MPKKYYNVKLYCKNYNVSIGCDVQFTITVQLSEKIDLTEGRVIGTTVWGAPGTFVCCFWTCDEAAPHGQSA